MTITRIWIDDKLYAVTSEHKTLFAAIVRAKQEHPTIVKDTVMVSYDMYLSTAEYLEQLNRDANEFYRMQEESYEPYDPN